VYTFTKLHDGRIPNVGVGVRVSSVRFQLCEPYTNIVRFLQKEVWERLLPYPFPLFSSLPLSFLPLLVTPYLFLSRGQH